MPLRWTSVEGKSVAQVERDVIRLLDSTVCHYPCADRDVPAEHASVREGKRRRTSTQPKARAGALVLPTWLTCADLVSRLPECIASHSLDHWLAAALRRQSLGQWHASTAARQLAVTAGSTDAAVPPRVLMLLFAQHLAAFPVFCEALDPRDGVPRLAQRISHCSDAAARAAWLRGLLQHRGGNPVYQSLLSAIVQAGGLSMRLAVVDVAACSCSDLEAGEVARAQFLGALLVDESVSDTEALLVTAADLARQVIAPASAPDTQADSMALLVQAAIQRHSTSVVVDALAACVRSPQRVQWRAAAQAVRVLARQHDAVWAATLAELTASAVDAESDLPVFPALLVLVRAAVTPTAAAAGSASAGLLPPGLDAYQSWLMRTLMPRMTARRHDLAVLRCFASLVSYDPLPLLRCHLNVLVHAKAELRLTDMAAEVVAALRQRIAAVTASQPAAQGSSGGVPTARADVDRYAKAYQETERIPATLTQAKLMRPAWYETSFLPELMYRPRLQQPGRIGLLTALLAAPQILIPFAMRPDVIELLDGTKRGADALPPLDPACVGAVPGTPLHALRTRCAALSTTEAVQDSLTAELTVAVAAVAAAGSEAEASVTAALLLNMIAARVPVLVAARDTPAVSLLCQAVLQCLAQHTAWLMPGLRSRLAAVLCGGDDVTMPSSGQTLAIACFLAHYYASTLHTVDPCLDLVWLRVTSMPWPRVCWLGRVFLCLHDVATSIVAESDALPSDLRAFLAWLSVRAQSLEGDLPHALTAAVRDRQLAASPLPSLPLLLQLEACAPAPCDDVAVAAMVSLPAAGQGARADLAHAVLTVPQRSAAAVALHWLRLVPAASSEQPAPALSWLRRALSTAPVSRVCARLVPVLQAVCAADAADAAAVLLSMMTEVPLGRAATTWLATVAKAGSVAQAVAVDAGTDASPRVMWCRAVLHVPLPASQLSTMLAQPRPCALCVQATLAAWLLQRWANEQGAAPSADQLRAETQLHKLTARLAIASPAHVTQAFAAPAAGSANVQFAVAAALCDGQQVLARIFFELLADLPSVQLPMRLVLHQYAEIRQADVPMPGIGQRVRAVLLHQCDPGDVCGLDPALTALYHSLIPRSPSS